MKFTNDTPRMLNSVQPAIHSHGPVFISNHDQFGFNIRHFYQDWSSGEWKATKKGVAVAPEDAPLLVAELVAFMNEVEIVPGVTYELVAHHEEE